MSTRTLIEINHDHLARLSEDDFWRLVARLRSSILVGELNEGQQPFVGSAIRILAQHHHSTSTIDALKLQGRACHLRRQANRAVGSVDDF